MVVLVTGATGFVGSYVVRALLDAGHDVRALVRTGSEHKLDARSHPRVQVASGDITEPATLPEALAGCDAVVHLVGIIDEHPSKGVTFERIHVEGTRHLVEATKQAGITRYVHMSANGASPDGDSAYQTTKWQAEEIVRAAAFPHTVLFRPSILFGTPGPGQPEFCTQLWTTLIKPFPVLPILGDGQYRLQPIHVTEVAAAFAQAVTRDDLAGRTFEAGGHASYTFDEVVDLIARGAGIEPKSKLHQPLWLAKVAVHTVGALGLLPISPAQFAMLIAGNTCDERPFYAAFDVQSVPFTPENLAYVRDAA